MRFFIIVVPFQLCMTTNDPSIYRSGHGIDTVLKTYGSDKGFDDIVCIMNNGDKQEVNSDSKEEYVKSIII